MNVASTSNTPLAWKKKWRRSHDMTGPLVPTTPDSVALTKKLRDLVMIAMRSIPFSLGRSGACSTSS